MRRSFVSNREPNHWHTAQTASSILASNPYLNPLLTTMSSSARCFSTAPPFRTKDALSDLHDPVNDEVKASVERKYQESLGWKSGRRRAEATAARVEARAQRKREQPEATSEPALSPSPRPERQAIQKTALMRDLRTQSTLTNESPAAQSAPAALDDLSLEALNARVTDMREKLKEAEAIDWKYIYEETSRSFSIKDMPNYRSFHSQRRVQEAKKADQERTASLKQVMSDQKAHLRETKQLAESIVALEAFIKQQQHVKSEMKSKTESKVESKAATGAPTKNGTEAVEDAEDKRRRLEAIQSRRAELLKRKDSIAVKMAQLTAAMTSSPPPTKTRQTQLRLFVPKGKKFLIDHFLTVNFDAPDYELAWQVNAMRVRLRKFVPPLDSLPLPVKMSNEEQLRMWLKVLVARYQDKTGVQAGLLDAEGGEWEELSPWEMHRMAKQAKEVVEWKSEVPSGQMTMAQRKMHRQERRAREEGLRRARRERQVARRRAYARDLEQLQLKGMYPAAVKRAEKRLAAKAAERAAWLLKSPPSPSPSPSPTPSSSPPDSQPPIRVVLAKTSWTPPEDREYEPEPRVRMISASKDGVSHGNTDTKRPSPQPPTESTNLHLKGNVRKLYPPTLTKLVRGYSTTSSPDDLNAHLKAKEAQAQEQDPSPQPQPQPNTAPLPTHLPHLTQTGTAHMVAITAKPHTPRTAIAVGTVFFSNPTALSLIASNTLKKGDVLSVSRIAGIMAAKKCPEIVPLCHPITLTHVGVGVRTFPPSPSEPAASGARAGGGDDMGHGGVQIECKVACTGATGVEMEALTAVMGAALSVVDMCKAVDKFQRIGEVRVVLKEGGKSGVWREEGWGSWQTKDGE